MTALDQPGFREFWDAFSPVFGQLLGESTVPDEFIRHLRNLRTSEHISGPVLDAGCGEGRFSLAMARDGHEVVALDQDDRAIGILRQRALVEGLAIDARISDLLDVPSGPERFDVILLLGCTLIMMKSDAQRLLLSRLSALLSEGGHLVVDMHSREHIDRLHRDGQAVELTLGTYQDTPVSARAEWHPDDDEWVLHYQYFHDSEPVTALERATVPSENRLRDDADRAGLTLVDRMARWDGAPPSPDHPLVIHTYRKNRST